MQIQEEEALRIHCTRRTEQAKNLNVEQQNFVRTIVTHIKEMISIYLEPLVSQNQKTRLFEHHFEKATNRNLLCLEELMTNSRFANVLSMEQPRFVTLFKKHTQQFKQHLLLLKGKKEDDPNKPAWNF